MGMDVYGRENPEAYFRLNVWSWSPLYLLIKEANLRFKLGISQKCMEAMEFNEGAGLRTQAKCDRLADALEKLLPEDTSDLICFLVDQQIGERMRLRMLQTEEQSTEEIYFRIKREDVKDFIGFLRECGGFQVW